MSAIIRCWLRDYYKLEVDDRLDLDMAITTLYYSRVISRSELQIINMAKKQCTYVEMATKLDIAFNTVKKRLRSASTKIALYMGINDNELLFKIEKTLGRKLTTAEEESCARILETDGRWPRGMDNVFD